MNNELITKIKNLQNEDLDFYKKLINFFDLLGVNTNDLANLVMFLKNFQKMMDTLNAIVKDQNKINELINKKENPEENRYSNPLEEFNKQQERMNIYGSKR